nr:cell wall-binding repeat-containing protein [Sedimentibacter sp.]
MQQFFNPRSGCLRMMPEPRQAEAEEHNTVNTTRMNHEDMYSFNIAMTKMIYPSQDISWKPNAVILVPADKWQYSLCASSVVHFPINAPIMFSERNYLPEISIREIQRMGPTGNEVPAQVLIAGPISNSVENMLKMEGLTVYRITDEEDVYESCIHIADFRLNEIPSESEEGRRDIIVISGQDYSEGITASFYAAHKGTPIILVEQDIIPEPVMNFINNNKDKNYYILGNEKTVGPEVEEEISGIIDGNVIRISASNPYTISVKFAEYASEVDSFGWKHNTKDGWAFAFGELKRWYNIVSSCLLAHLGKHTPLLLTDKDHLPDAVTEYVVRVNPEKEMPSMPPYMHSYVLGSLNDITHTVQVEIEKVLDVAGKKEH